MKFIFIVAVESDVLAQLFGRCIWLGNFKKIISGFLKFGRERLGPVSFIGRSYAIHAANFHDENWRLVNGTRLIIKLF